MTGSSSNHWGNCHWGNWIATRNTDQEPCYFSLPQIIALLVLSGCYWGHPLPLPEPLPEAVHPSPELLSEFDGPYAVTVAAITDDISVGEAVFGFPSFGLKGKGFLCNQSRSADYVETFAAADRYLGDWAASTRATVEDVLIEHRIISPFDHSDALFGNDDRKATHGLVLFGRVRHVRGNFCQQHHWWLSRPTEFYSGEMYLDMQWSWVQICQGPGTLLRRNLNTPSVVTTRVYGLQETPRLSGIAVLLDRLVALSTRNLLGDPITRNVLKSQGQKQGVNNASCKK